jgi:hypothetical protein
MGRRKGRWGRIAPAALAIACVLATPRVAAAYSVLAHEAIIDAAWDASIVPALRARFHPSPADLKRARAFAYGGSLIQDIGYYPFSSRFFGNLAHYVRSGDFIESLVDSTYARLVETLVKRREAGVTIPPPLLANIITFYTNLDAPIETRKHKREWNRLLRDLDRIRPACLP